MVTFLLNKIEDKYLVGSDLEIQNPADVVADFFQNLKNALKWGVEMEEDVLYFICGENWQQEFDFEQLRESLYELANINIYSVYTNVVAQDRIWINERFSATMGIQKIHSFILLRPMFQLVLSYLDLVSEFPQVSWNNFLEKIIPHSFVLNYGEKFSLKPNKFHVISTFRNVEKYIGECVTSILDQDYQNYNVTFIDDCSDDNSSKLIPKSRSIKTIINNDRKYALQNILDALNENALINDDDTIICILDGDDLLSHKYVLNILNYIYQDDNLLFTYGAMHYKDNPAKIRCPYTIGEFEDLRNSQWKIAHLRTFRYKLFKKFKEMDPALTSCRDSEGSIIHMPADMALLFPLIELAGYKNARFIDIPLYTYRIHPNNDHILNREKQFIGEQMIRSKMRFSPAF